MITQKILKQALRHDPDTGIFYWLVRSPKKNIGDVAGRVNQLGYIQITIGQKMYYAHRLAWLYMFGRFPKRFIDHIDRNPSNNRIANLREATNAQNHMNAGLNAANKSGIKGVFAYKGKWRAALCSQYLGTFETKDAAAAVYRSAAIAKYGEFACGCS